MYPQTRWSQAQAAVDGAAAEVGVGAALVTDSAACDVRDWLVWWCWCEPLVRDFRLMFLLVRESEPTSCLPVESSASDIDCINETYHHNKL